MYGTECYHNFVLDWVVQGGKFSGYFSHEATVFELSVALEMLASEQRSKICKDVRNKCCALLICHCSALHKSTS